VPEVLALDPGFGNTKVCLGGKIVTLQSVVARPSDLGMAAIGMRSAAHVLGVSFDHERFVVGSGAWKWGEPITSQDYSAISSTERKALFYAALASLLPEKEHKADLLVIGLPVPLLQDTSQTEAVLTGLKSYKGDHQFRVGNLEYSLSINHIKVLPQPVGAYADWLLNDELQIRKGGAHAEVAVLDLGENTLDLYVVQGGKVSPRFIGGGKVGVRRLLHLLSGTGHDIVELDHDLRTGRLKPDGAQIEGWLGEVLGTIEHVWPNLSRFSAVVPTGGGCVVLGSILQTVLATRGAAIHWPKDPVTANAIGLWKWGCYGGNR
jgi:hypothetical protein